MSQRAKQWKLSTQTCPRMSKVAHGRVLVSQNGAESYHGQSWSLVVVSRRGQSFFMVSRYFACEMRERYDNVMKVFWKN